MRFNLVGSIIGQRGTGKSLFLLGSKYSAKQDDATLKIPSLIDIAIANKMKVLILDTLDHPTYRRIPVLDQKHFNKFKSGVARTWCEPDNMMTLVRLINQSKHLNNTFIVFEDAGKYTGKNLTKPLVRLIADSKQRNIDIAFMFHCWIDTPGDIFTKSDYIQLFKTEDKPYVRRNKISQYDKIEKIDLEVKAHPNRFYGKYIDTRTS